MSYAAMNSDSGYVCSWPGAIILTNGPLGTLWTPKLLLSAFAVGGSQRDRSSQTLMMPKCTIADICFDPALKSLQQRKCSIYSTFSPRLVCQVLARSPQHHLEHAEICIHLPPRLLEGRLLD
jgi:hypothetical protein